MSGAADGGLLARGVRRWARDRLAAGDDQRELDGAAGARPVRTANRYRGEAPPGEVLLGPDPVLFDGVEPGGQPDGVRVPDIQPIADPFTEGRPCGFESTDCGDDATPATRWRPRGGVLPAVLRLL